MLQKFSAKIYKLGINPCVDVPEPVGAGFGKKGYVPVKGTLDEFPIRATLVPKGGGLYRLHINGEMRKGAGVDVGDQIHLVLEYDPEPRELPVPAELTTALRDNPSAKVAYESQTPSRQKEILAYLNSLKRPETPQRNIDKLINQLSKTDN